MYRSQGALGEYFAGQAGMGDYLQAAAGMDGALVDWARKEEAEAGHRGIFGVGEYFATNGLGADAPVVTGSGIPYAVEYAGGIAGLVLGALLWKKNRLMGALIGAALGAGGSYAVSKMGYQGG